MDGKKVILVDVDGVLRDLMGKCCEIYKRDFDPKSEATPNDVKDWNFNPVFPKTPIPAHKLFFSEYAEELFSSALPFDPAVADYMAMIKEHGEVVIATDQPNGNGIYTLDWLRKYNIPYDGIFISPNKTLLKADIALDDRLSNLESFRDAGIKAVCYSQTWNDNGRWNGPAVKDLHGFHLYLHDLEN